MLNKVNVKNIINSFYLGLFIGVCVHLFVGNEGTGIAFVVGVLVSGIIGLAIGGVTEIFTAILPISIAKAKTYFFINNFIAVVVALIIFIVGKHYFGEDIPTDDYIQMLLLIVSLIIIANILEYLNYRHTNNKLKKFKESRKEYI